MFGSSSSDNNSKANGSYQKIALVTVVAAGWGKV
jgi:hypothetical protein